MSNYDDVRVCGKPVLVPVDKDISKYKFDSGKVRMSLMTSQFRNAIKGVANILTFGASKYPHPSTGDRSWSYIPVEQYMDALERHMSFVYKDFERQRVQGSSPYASLEDCSVDGESGQLHIDHAITNLLFIREKLYPDTDIPVKLYKESA